MMSKGPARPSKLWFVMLLRFLVCQCQLTVECIVLQRKCNEGFDRGLERLCEHQHTVKRVLLRVSHKMLDGGNKRRCCTAKSTGKTNSPKPQAGGVRVVSEWGGKTQQQRLSKTNRLQPLICALSESVGARCAAASHCRGQGSNKRGQPASTHACLCVCVCVCVCASLSLSLCLCLLLHVATPVQPRAHLPTHTHIHNC